MPEGRLRPSGAKLPFDSPAPRNHRRPQGEPHNNLNTASFGASPLSATRRFIWVRLFLWSNRPVSLPVATLLRARSQGSETRLPIDCGPTRNRTGIVCLHCVRPVTISLPVDSFRSIIRICAPVDSGRAFLGETEKKHGEGFGCVSERRLGPHLRGLTLPFNADSRHGWDRGLSA